jgi:hypothetical protein
MQTNPLLLPTITSFVPSLPAGAAFRVSIHCWQNPEVSRYVQNLEKASDNIVFEARLFLDGRIAGYTLTSHSKLTIPVNLIPAQNGSIKQDHGPQSLNSVLVCTFFFSLSLGRTQSSIILLRVCPDLL